MNYMNLYSLLFIYEYIYINTYAIIFFAIRCSFTLAVRGVAVFSTSQAMGNYRIVDDKLIFFHFIFFYFLFSEKIVFDISCQLCMKCQSPVYGEKKKQKKNKKKNPVYREKQINVVC